MATIDRTKVADARGYGLMPRLRLAAYHMLKDGTLYNDLGRTHIDRQRPETQARLVKRLAELSFSVDLKPVAAPS
jgi:hypothetical protein